MGLKELYNVLKELGQLNQIRVIYSDNCCHERNMLHEIFGDHVKVFLDLFHAIQRITKSVGKRFPRYKEFCKDVKHCFRQRQDRVKKKRSMATPSAPEIRDNLDDLLRKWPELSEHAISEIEKLKTEHATCLAEMEPHKGTAKVCLL